MKRVGNLYEEIISIDNLELADEKARKGKLRTYGVIKFDENRANNILLLHEILKNKTYKTSRYKTFKIYEPKEREIFQLPYFPDRIVHHAIMNILEPIWYKLFTFDTYSCIKGRGIHLAMKDVKEALKDKEGTIYCLKLDIRKYYPSIDHEILKKIIRKKIKCKDTLWLLYEIIDSANGVPIGNYLSQYFANIYLSYFDHWLKEVLKVKYYFRYADDMVFLSGDKEELRNILRQVDCYLRNNLKLDLKRNYQIFPVDARGLDYIGFVFYHDHTKMRKRIKNRVKRKIKKVNNKKLSLQEYRIKLCGWIGWMKYSDSRHFINKHIDEIYRNKLYK